jgi:catalase
MLAANNLVPGIGASPDKMLLARISAYADAHRARIGVNYKQLPVNAPQVPVHNYSKDGAMRYIKVSDPLYAPNSKGGARATANQQGVAERRGHGAQRLHVVHAARRRLRPAGHLGPRGSRRRRA